MTDNERALLLAEKSRIEAVIAEIRQTKDAKELEVIRGGHSPQQEFNLRRKIELESRQASASVRVRPWRVWSGSSASVSVPADLPVCSPNRRRGEFSMD